MVSPQDCVIKYNTETWTPHISNVNFLNLGVRVRRNLNTKSRIDLKIGTDM